MRLRAGAVVLCLLLFLYTDALPAGGALTVSAEQPSGAEEAVRLLRDGLWDCLDSIDLSACRLPRAEMGGLFAAVMLDNPALFHVDSRMSFTYDRAGCVLSVFPTYTLTGDALEEARGLYDDTIRVFLSELAAASAPPLILPSGNGGDTAPAWSEADTVLFIHEWMADRYDYDESGTRFDALSMFRDGVGVCQAYALGFLALARAAGLEAEVVVSEEMDHAWNLVRVDGSWYHVDVTQDDSGISRRSNSRRGDVSAVYHDRLLMSDAAAQALGYVGYEIPPEYACDSERFAALAGLPPVCLRRVGDGWLTTVGGLPCRADLGTGAPGLPGDADGDGAVTLSDLLLLDLYGIGADTVRALLLAAERNAGNEENAKGETF